MSPDTINEIERKAHQMRATEIARLLGIIATRLRIYSQAVIENGVRPLFSWNPQAHRPR